MRNPANLTSQIAVHGYAPSTRDASKSYQLKQAIGDTKRGTFIAMDRYGNKYYENLEEDLPRKKALDICQIDWAENN